MIKIGQRWKNEDGETVRIIGGANARMFVLVTGSVIRNDPTKGNQWLYTSHQLEELFKREEWTLVARKKRRSK